MNELSSLLRPARLVRAYPKLAEVLRVADWLVVDGSSIDEGAWEKRGLNVLEAQAFMEIDDALPGDWKRDHRAQVTEVMMEVRRVAVFQRFGSQAFIIDGAVTTELAETSLDDLLLSELHLPFDCFFVGFEGQIGFDADHFFEGFYVHCGAEDLMVTICLHVFGRETPNWQLHKTFAVRADIAGIQKIDELIERSLAAHQETIEHSLEVATAEKATFPDGLEDMYDASTEALARDLQFAKLRKDQISASLRLAFNVLFLLASLPDTMVQPNVIWPKPRQLRPGTSHKTERGALPTRYVSFGYSEQVLTPIGVGSSASPRAHWRRGHWRRTPYGPVSDRAYRPKWIRPTLVNPDHGPVAEASIYRVDP